MSLTVKTPDPKTRHAGMHEPACMLLQQLLKMLLLRACVRAWLPACVIDTMYQLIYSSEQTQAWRIEFPYRNIDEYWARSKGRVRGAAPRTRPFDRAQYS